MAELIIFVPNTDTTLDWVLATNQAPVEFSYTPNELLSLIELKLDDDNFLNVSNVEISFAIRGQSFDFIMHNEVFIYIKTILQQQQPEFINNSTVCTVFFRRTADYRDLYDDYNYSYTEVKATDGTFDMPDGGWVTLESPVGADSAVKVVLIVISVLVACGLLTGLCFRLYKMKTNKT